MSESPQELFKEAKQGDREAFWRLIAPHRGLIYSVAFGMLKDSERAEDQLHDVMVTAFKSISNLRDPSKLPSWLYSITRYRTMELMRKEMRLRGALQKEAEGPTPVVSVSELEEKEQWLQSMEKALRGLPEPFRVVLALKYTNNYSCRQIAEILEVSVSAVKSRLFEARKLLKKMTQELHAREGETTHGLR